MEENVMQNNGIYNSQNSSNGGSNGWDLLIAIVKWGLIMGGEYLTVRVLSSSDLGVHFKHDDKGTEFDITHKDEEKTVVLSEEENTLISEDADHKNKETDEEAEEKSDE